MSTPDPLAALMAAVRPESVDDASVLDLLAAHAKLLSELHAMRRVLVEAALPPEGEDDEPLLALLRDVQRALLIHPIAGQALYSGLIAEGRRFAETEEGAAWLDALRRSPALARVGPVWEVLSAGMLEPDAGAAMPSAWVDALVALSGRATPEDLLRRATGGG